MKNYVMNRKSVYAGTQEEIARTICLFLWGDASKQAVRCVVDFIRVQRTIGSGEFMWRGVGIDTTARACKCWVEDRHAVNAFRKSVGVSEMAGGIRSAHLMRAGRQQAEIAALLRLSWEATKNSKGDLTMKTYTFCVHNWKSGNRAFWLSKSFPSAYIADRWAMKLSFGSKNSPYMVVFIPGKEF